jgi:predicted NAD/FAD-binding protein
MRIAIIGTRISGLVSAWLLDRKFEVHVFEKFRRVGGHTRTMLHRVVYNDPVEDGAVS